MDRMDTPKNPMAPIPILKVQRFRKENWNFPRDMVRFLSDLGGSGTILTILKSFSKQRKQFVSENNRHFQKVLFGFCQPFRDFFGTI